MDDPRDRRIGGLLGLLGAVLIGLDGLLDLARGLFFVAIGRVGPGYFPLDQGVILVVVALIVAAFSVVGGLRREGRATVAGAVLLVVVVVGWLELGLGSGLLSLLGALLGLVAGVVFLVSGR
jgi:hypothetical protein